LHVVFGFLLSKMFAKSESKKQFCKFSETEIRDQEMAREM